MSVPLSFLTPGNYPDDDPAGGLEATLALFEHGEALGFRGGWVRQRHLEHGISSAAVFLGAASQRTSTLELGTAVIPIGYETPFRLAEDLATADALSDGRLQPGFSTGMPHAELLAEEVWDPDWRSLELGHGRVQQVIDHLRGNYLGDPDTVIESPGNVQRPRLQPYRPGLADRVWYGGTSLRSVRWSGAAGVHLLTGNIISAAGYPGSVGAAPDFGAVQAWLIDEYRAAGGTGRRVALGRVIVPTDGASPATVRRYREYAASRRERTLVAHGERATLFAPDLVGPAASIAEELAADPAVVRADELRLELPYEFSLDDYRQILQDAATELAPLLPVPVPVGRG